MLSISDEAGISYDGELITFITPLGYTKTAEHYLTLGVNDTVENMVNKMRERLVYEYTNNIRLKSGVKEYLEMLKGENTRLFVRTANPLSALSITAFFTFLKRSGRLRISGSPSWI